MKDNTLIKEKEYLEQVKEILTKTINKYKSSIDRNKEDIYSLKKFMWDNFNDYTESEMNSAYYEVDNDVERLNEKIKLAFKYESAKSSPYFGKVVFNDETFHEFMNIYIGMITIQKNGIFYVYDWRSPISGLFYNYELGKAMYDAPNGQVCGTIEKKMQFKILDGELIRCFDCDINIEDDFLQEILSKSSSHKMKNIVSTIQREQNEVIRNIKDKYLLVQGVAGSGKTSVALHRIAFLMYQNKDLNSNNILIFSPNDVFSDYISNVLPELGEENVLKTTFSDFARTYLERTKKIEGYDEFLNRIYINPLENDIISYKMSNEYKNQIDKFYEEYSKNIVFNDDIQIKDMIFTKHELTEMFFGKYLKFTIKERINQMSENICYRTGIPIKKFVNKIRKILMENSNINLDYYDLYNSFLESKYFSKKIVANKVNKNKINYEDITPLLYLNFKINDYPNCNYIRQVVIDEAQDYTYFQMEILKNIFSSTSFTILGDINQTINSCYKYDSLNELNGIFEGANYLELTKTYRSSEEIIDYTNNILNIANSCSIRRNNNMPVTVKNIEKEKIVDQIQKDLLDMKQLNLQKIAIITKNAKKAIKLYNSISLENQDIQLISDSKNVVVKNIIIIPSYLSKGLEFEGVIVCNDSNDEYFKSECNLYYVVCTRAQHKLNIYNEPKILKKS